MAAFPRAVAAALSAALVFWACSGGNGSGSVGLLPDSDHDGLVDRLERALGSDPRDPSSPFARGDLELRSAFDARDPDDPHPRGGDDLEGETGPALDGISDALESYLALRGAHIPVTADSDSDRDGTSDVLEVRTGSNPFDARDPAYGRAFDLDKDGVSDARELLEGSNELDADFPTFDGADDDDGGLLGPDGDRISDGLEGWLVRRGARPPVTTLSDSDGDGAPDFAEVQAGFDPFDPDSPVANGARDSDGDGLSDALEALLVRKGASGASRTSDADRDGVSDAAELFSGSSPFERADPTLFGHFDLDGDGVPDFLELEHGSDPLDQDDPLVEGRADVDDATGPAGDPISDALEALMIRLGTSAPVTTYSDSDLDGVPDFVELRLVSGAFDANSPLR